MKNVILLKKVTDLIEFTDCSNSIVDDYDEGKHKNIRSFSQTKGIGKTFEYAIAYENPQTIYLYWRFYIK